MILRYFTTMSPKNSGGSNRSRNANRARSKEPKVAASNAPTPKRTNKNSAQSGTECLSPPCPPQLPPKHVGSKAGPKTNTQNHVSTSLIPSIPTISPSGEDNVLSKTTESTDKVSLITYPSSEETRSLRWAIIQTLLPEGRR